LEELLREPQKRADVPTALETNAREEESLKTQNNHTAGGASIDSGSKSNGLCFGDRWVVGDDHTIHNVVIVDVCPFDVVVVGLVPESKNFLPRFRPHNRCASSSPSSYASIELVP
jgi:hypothetical protein